MDGLIVGGAVAIIGVFVMVLLWGAGKQSFKYDGLLKIAAIFVGGGMILAGAVVAYRAGPLTLFPPGPPGGGATLPVWEWRIDGATAANFVNSNHDAATEYPDSPLVACDGGTPDLDLTVPTLATHIFWDPGTATMTLEMTVDDDLTATAASYELPDCGNFDIFYKPSNFVDNNNDSIMDDIEVFARWRGWSSYQMLGSAENGTQSSSQNIYTWSNAGGWQFGFGDEVDAPAWAHAASDHGYIAACSPSAPGYSTSGPNSACGSRWVAVGIYDDGDPDVINPWWAFANNGVFGYRAVKGMSITADIDVGVPSSFFTVHFRVVLQTIG